MWTGGAVLAVGYRFRINLQPALPSLSLEVPYLNPETPASLRDGFEYTRKLAQNTRLGSSCPVLSTTTRHGLLAECIHSALKPARESAVGATQNQRRQPIYALYGSHARDPHGEGL